MLPAPLVCTHSVESCVAARLLETRSSDGPHGTFTLQDNTIPMAEGFKRYRDRGRSSKKSTEFFTAILCAAVSSIYCLREPCLCWSRETILFPHMAVVLQGADDLETLSEDARLLMSDKDALLSTMQTTHDSHTSKLDAVEDALLSQETSRASSLVTQYTEWAHSRCASPLLLSICLFLGVRPFRQGT